MEKRFLISAFIMILYCLLPHVKAEGSFWDKIVNTFKQGADDATSIVHQTVQIAGNSINLGQDALGAAQSFAIDVQQTTMGCAQAVNAKAFVFFNKAVPIPQFWNTLQDISNKSLEANNKFTQSANMTSAFAQSTGQQLLKAAVSGN
ncbi:MAG: hypothetical protein HQM08_18050 [Candidatus Riflebacteria bacterium]|nr:hypothetical protein [Candidatus Riflebacteria bacterium]